MRNQRNQRTKGVVYRETGGISVTREQEEWYIGKREELAKKKNKGVGIQGKENPGENDEKKEHNEKNTCLYDYIGNAVHDVSGKHYRLFCHESTG
jgi:hypothetical protein